MLDTRLHDRILGRGEWQAVDQYQTQRRALYVDPFPEAGAAEQERGEQSGERREAHLHAIGDPADCENHQGHFRGNQEG